MDPASPFAILSAVSSLAGVVLNLPTRLYSFIKATNLIDKSIEALYREVKALENILNTTEKSLTGAIRDEAEDPTLSDNSVWTSLENVVEDCRVSVEAFKSLVQDVRTDNKTHNPLKKAFKQINLNLRTQAIVAVRSRIHTHSICLQLAVQSITVYVYTVHPFDLALNPI